MHGNSKNYTRRSMKLINYKSKRFLQLQNNPFIDSKHLKKIQVKPKYTYSPKNKYNIKIFKNLPELKDNRILSKLMRKQIKQRRFYYNNAVKKKKIICMTTLETDKKKVQRYIRKYKKLKRKLLKSVIFKQKSQVRVQNKIRSQKLLENINTLIKAQRIRKNLLQTLKSINRLEEAIKQNQSLLIQKLLKKKYLKLKCYNDGKFSTEKKYIVTMWNSLFKRMQTSFGIRSYFATSLERKRLPRGDFLDYSYINLNLNFKFTNQKKKRRFKNQNPYLRQYEYSLFYHLDWMLGWRAHPTYVKQTAKNTPMFATFKNTYATYVIKRKRAFLNKKPLKKLRLNLELKCSSYFRLWMSYFMFHNRKHKAKYILKDRSRFMEFNQKWFQKPHKPADFYDQLVENLSFGFKDESLKKNHMWTQTATLAFSRYLVNNLQYRMVRTFSKAFKKYRIPTEIYNRSFGPIRDQLVPTLENIKEALKELVIMQNAAKRSSSRVYIQRRVFFNKMLAYDKKNKHYVNAYLAATSKKVRNFSGMKSFLQQLSSLYLNNYISSLYLKNCKTKCIKMIDNKRLFYLSVFRKISSPYKEVNYYVKKVTSTASLLQASSHIKSRLLIASKIPLTFLMFLKRFY